MSALDSQTQDVLTALRQATAGRHAELDSSMPLANSNASLADYRDHLLLLQDWMQPLQCWLESFADGPQTAGFFPCAPYASLIRQDLADPAMPQGDVGVAANIAWPPRAGAAYRWGVSYVVEGSQLGGAVLHRRLKQKLAPHPLHYLAGDGSPGARWKNFIAALHGAVHDGAAIDEACRGACDAFDRLIALKRESEMPA